MDKCNCRIVTVSKYNTVITSILANKGYLNYGRQKLDRTPLIKCNIPFNAIQIKRYSIYLINLLLRVRQVCVNQKTLCRLDNETSAPVSGLNGVKSKSDVGSI